MQLNPEQLRTELFLSKDMYKETAWHKAAETGETEMSEDLWDLAEELQLKPDHLRNEMLFSKTSIWKLPGKKQQKLVKLK